VQRLYLLLSCLVLTALLAGCAPRVKAQSNDVKALENAAPEDIPDKSIPAESAEIEIVSKDPPADCPITVPQDPPFAAPAPYSAGSSFDWDFWYGSNSLWTAVPKNGVWFGLPHNPEGYTQKVFWWREGYVWTEESEPALTVTGERLDAAAPPLNASKATNAYASDIGSAMLVGVDFPTLGCWKITGQYQNSALSFVVWVAP
jgi:hypothetical protein